MNFFELVFRLAHRRDKKIWKSAVAVFTGKCEKATVRTKMGPRAAAYNAYEIVYDVNGKKRHGWYTFHPLDDPDPRSLTGKTVNIRYNIRKPFIFERDI